MMINIFFCFCFTLQTGITITKYITLHSCKPISMKSVMIFLLYPTIMCKQKVPSSTHVQQRFFEICNDLHRVLKGRTQVMEYNQTSNAEC